MKNICLALLSIVLMFSCKTSKITQKLKKGTTEEYVGVLVTDTKTGKVFFSKNAENVFVPASNTKILTLYSALHSLPDSIPALKYFSRNDTLFALGTGDPTLLHPDFNSSVVLELFNKAKTIVISDQNSAQTPYGVGWAWDDYDGYYQAELSSFPIYGNVLRASVHQNQIKVSPDFFKKDVKDSLLLGRNLTREQWGNLFYYDSKVKRTDTFKQDIPFKTGMSLTASLLSEVLNKPVVYQRFKITEPLKTAFSHPVDTVLRKMMQESDNLLAEQLLLLSGSSDTISTALSIQKNSKLWLGDFNLPYKWRDGSGLSRYNLLSPALLVHVLNKMHHEFPEERIFSLMSIGGKAGTLKGKYKAEKPYVFAKTGSMSGVYNESGYVISKSGRLLTYSIMRNNFTGTISENGKKTMDFVNWLREKY